MLQHVSLQGPVSDPKRVCNTHIVIDEDGNIRATYAKSHLFDLDLQGRVRLCESDYTVPGQSITPPVATPVGNVALSTVSLVFRQISWVVHVICSKWNLLAAASEIRFCLLLYNHHVCTKYCTYIMKIFKLLMWCLCGCGCVWVCVGGGMDVFYYQVLETLRVYDGLLLALAYIVTVPFKKSSDFF